MTATQAEPGIRAHAQSEIGTFHPSRSGNASGGQGTRWESRTPVRVGEGVARPGRPGGGVPSGAAAEVAVRPSWRARHLLVLAGVAVLVGWLAYDYREAFTPELWRTQFTVGWALLAALAMSAVLAGNAWNLLGASPLRLRFWPTFAVQLAASLVRVVSPAAVGAAAVNVQYLRRAGVGGAASVGTVSVAQSVQILLAVVLLPPVAVATGMDALVLDGEQVWIAAAVVAGVVVLAALAVVVVRRSPLLEARLRVVLSELTTSLRTMARSPRRAAVSVAGAMLISAGLIVAMWSSVHAFGGSIGVLTAAGVLLVGTSAGNLLPVPGGIGSVDAALVAMLTAAGTSLAVALPAVALFRLVTMWLLLPAGLVSFGVLRRRGRL